MRATVRFKLTALYGAVFAASGAVLLGVAYLLVRDNLVNQLTIVADPRELAGSPQRITLVERDLGDNRARVLRDLVLIFGGVLAATGVAAFFVGWWLSGRVLRPLRRITTTARGLSAADLGKRLALAGPRDELTELAATFDGMLDRLQAAFDSQRRFVANASHELRTPLAVQRAAIQIGLGGAAPLPREQVLDHLLETNTRMERLIDGLLTLARSERGRAATAPVALREVVAEAVDRRRAEAAERGVAVRVAVDERVLDADPVLFPQLVGNLVDNAVRHNVDGGQVWVESTPTGFAVANTGAPLDPAEVPPLFEPFRRRTERSGAQGAGLGLSIVAAIATAHGWRVEATPRPDGGLRVRVDTG